MRAPPVNGSAPIARACVAIFVAAAVLATAPIARAQIVSDPLHEPDEPVYVPELRGDAAWAVGFDVGIGVVEAGCAECESLLGGFSAAVHVGRQLTPRLAAMIDAHAVVHLLDTQGLEKGVFTHSVIALAARAWPAPTVWIQSGVGIAVAGRTTTGVDDYALSPAVQLALGRELRHQPDGGIDLSVRANAGRFADDATAPFLLVSVSIAVGWHWR